MNNASESQSTKGERTRERLYQTAIQLFLTRGFEATTMRNIAETAECSLGLTYRYFRSKDDIVLALYRRSTLETSTAAENLPRAPLATRFSALMHAKIDEVRPYRSLLQSIIGAAMSPQHPIGVLSDHNADIRALAQISFLQAVTGATDAPNAQQTRELGALFYAAHLGILLFWLYDKTPNQRATNEVIAFAADLLKIGRRLLRLPPFARLLTRLVQAIEPLFGATNDKQQTTNN